MRHCADCKFFQIPKKPSDNGWGECTRLVGFSKPYEVTEVKAVAVGDEFSEGAWLLVRPDFGCVEFKDASK